MNAIPFTLLMTSVAETAAASAEQLNARLDRLLPLLADGGTAELEQIYAETKSLVYGFALSILKNPHSAEDVMQDTYVRLVQAAASYTPQGKPMAWILTIVRRLALMRLRRGDTAPSDTLEEWIAAPGDFTEDSLDRLVLQAALITLSEGEREIVMLHALSGLKHREIADLMELPLSTVLSKYRRALKKLRTIYEEESA